MNIEVDVEWINHNYLQKGILTMVCDCYHCNGNCKDCSWCENVFGRTCPVEEMSEKEIENSRSLFQQTYHGGYIISKHLKGFPEINGGCYRSPDFNLTEQDIENHIIPEEYRNKIHVKFNYLQDDREIKANTLDMFF